eukprot:3959045-Pyramimonas_sp.AAC.1
MAQRTGTKSSFEPHLPPKAAEQKNADTHRTSSSSAAPALFGRRGRRRRRRKRAEDPERIPLLPRSSRAGPQT